MTGQEWVCRDRVLAVGGRPLVMGILNVTPDSFSDGGRYFGRESAVARAREMVAEGADLVDVGGESTRPGAAPVSGEEEAARVLPVIRALAEAGAAVISVDTSKAGVARAAIEAGAHVINDVSALRADPDMARVARDSGAGVVLMHMRGEPRTMQNEPRYGDVVAEVAAFLGERVEAAMRSGIARNRLAVDPGIGFGKTVEHNLLLLRRLDALAALGAPVLVGVSRKSFLGRLTGREVGDRLPASLAALACAVIGGARILRVHDVRASVDAARVAAALGGLDEHDRLV